ncbi:hypothetical protein [Phragmitibacter flavus]|uniref:hypothetical protein n=1 Tax=Phragmitibacter flavus TaxID=2576071 RepID=UPI0014087CAA|nr:hypothetical protein [Phragmitibacter flavus]
MKLSAPTQKLFVVSLILAVLGLIGHFESVKYLSQYSFWLVVGAYALLTIGCMFRKA